MDYKRGDILEQEKQRALDYGIKRGEAMEELITSKGWAYIEEFLQKMIANHKANIESLILQRDIDKLTDVTLVARSYEFLLNLPKEFIRKKDEVLKNKGGNVNGR